MNPMVKRAVIFGSRRVSPVTLAFTDSDFSATDLAEYNRFGAFKK